MVASIAGRASQRPKSVTSQRVFGASDDTRFATKRSGRGFTRLCGPYNTMACSRRRHRVGVNGGIASGSISGWPRFQNPRKARRSPVV